MVKKLLLSLVIAAGTLSASAGVIHKCDESCLTYVTTLDYEIDGSIFR